MEHKELIKIMTFGELQRYLANHPQWRLPLFSEADAVNHSHKEFWVQDVVGDRRGVYNKGKLEPAHPLFQKNVLLLEAVTPLYKEGRKSNN